MLQILLQAIAAAAELLWATALRPAAAGAQQLLEMPRMELLLLLLLLLLLVFVLAAAAPEGADSMHPC
jgi:hypothetical protein